VVERLVLAASPRLPRDPIEGEPIRYVDWLISGLLAMNMMFSALFGVGYTIVRYRKTGVLKRLKATPLTAAEFLIAQLASRLVLLVSVSAMVYAGSHALIRFRMQGSYLDLGVVLVLGALCLISLGLLVAARISSEEFAGGLLNLLSWPMIFLSGVWFSLDGAHPWVRAVAQVFPLTHVIDAARAIMTEGATLAQVSPQLWVLGALTAAFVALGAWSFRWE
jgi:ABC-type multidrug transport system permease subunit